MQWGRLPFRPLGEGGDEDALAAGVPAAVALPSGEGGGHLPEHGAELVSRNKLFWEYIIFTDFPNTLREISSLSTAAAALA